MTKAQEKPKRQRLPDPNGGRSILEWVAKSPDEKVPEDVQLRIWRRQDGKCAITGIKIVKRSDAQLDHINPLSMGGQHRESNLHWILTEDAHKPKTAQEATRRAKADRQGKAHAGIKTPPTKPLKGRGFTPTEKPPRNGAAKIDKTALPPLGPSSIARRFG